MFNNPPGLAPTSPGIHASTAAAAQPSAVSPSVVSPTSRSRLRYLRLLNRETPSSIPQQTTTTTTASATTTTTTTTAIAAAATSPSVPPSTSTVLAPAASLTRSLSHTPVSSSSAAATASPFGLTHPTSLPPLTATAAVSSLSAHKPGTKADPDVSSSTGSAMTRTRSATDAGLAQTPGSSLDSLPSIRFSTFYDPRATRPSLTFTPVARTLPTGHEVIRVGRYSERDSQPVVPANMPSAAPVGFKSKVVSRRHCEFWCEAGKWFIKDVKSSSGTFLNHIRLSPPGTESKPFPINDGDIVQLGIDFKGGEEMIFRCVKMRLELNRGWQNKLNAFNMTTHKRLRNMTKSTDAGSSAQSSQDCSICLNSIAPCQCLFVAPCSHTWHYKCIRSLLASPQYPIFICPNCRAAADLEAEVEDPEEWEQLDSEDGNEADDSLHRKTEGSEPDDMEGVEKQQDRPPRSADAADVTVMQIDVPQQPEHRAPSPPAPVVSHATSEPVPIPAPAAGAAIRMAGRDTSTSTPTNDRQARTPSPTENRPAGNGHEGPITPRNDAGPWVFDGSGVRTRVAGRTSTDSRRGEMRSLDTAALEMAAHLPA